MEILWSIVFQLMELKAFSASTKSTASVLSCRKKSHLASMAAYAPASWPTHTCKDPAASWISFFAIPIITFPTTRRITSLTSTGRILGFLFRGIKRFAKNASRVSPSSLTVVFEFLVQNLLVKFASNFRRSKDEDRNDLETKTSDRQTLMDHNHPLFLRQLLI